MITAMPFATFGRLAVCALCLLVSKSVGAEASAAPRAADVRATMARAAAFMRSIATEGGYVWSYSPDLQRRAGEEPVTETQVWVQPPGTPAVGMAFLRAYEATGDDAYLDGAKAAADALAAGQLESGGWDYRIEFDPKLSARWFRRSEVGRISPEEAARRRNVSTYDDDNTQAALRLLVAVSEHGKGSDDARDVRIREARDYGLAKLVAAQRPNGGWPQRWNGVPVTEAQYPVLSASLPERYPREHERGDYYGHYTLNDQTHRDCVMTLLEAAKRLDRPDLRAAALKGGEFLLYAQLPEPQPAWAQQYNARMEPAWARAFEPPAVCSNESAGAMQLLIDLFVETGEARFLEPLPRAIAWFRRSELVPGVWARLYELQTNRPIFGDRDGRIHYSAEELSPERRNGYSWRGAYGVPAAMAYYDDVVQRGRDAVRELQTKKTVPRSPRQKAMRVQALAPRVREIVEALDERGRWVSVFRGNEGIRSATFIENMRVLSEYLETVE